MTCNKGRKLESNGQRLCCMHSNHLATKALSSFDDTEETINGRDVATLHLKLALIVQLNDGSKRETLNMDLSLVITRKLNRSIKADLPFYRSASCRYRCHPEASPQILAAEGEKDKMEIKGTITKNDAKTATLQTRSSFASRE